MDKTLNLDLRLLKYNQAQKEIIVNEALAVIDVIINRVVVGTITRYKDSDKNGSLYLIGDNPCDEWKEQKGKLTFYVNGWRYLMPKNGWLFWFEDRQNFYQYYNKKWMGVECKCKYEAPSLP